MRIQPNVALSLAAALVWGALLSPPARAVPMSSANYAMSAQNYNSGGAVGTTSGNYATFINAGDSIGPSVGALYLNMSGAVDPLFPNNIIVITINGHVIDLSTNGITGVQVDAWDTGGLPLATTFTLADGSGTYALNGLSVGNYKLKVTWTVNGVSSSLSQDNIARGSSDVDFTLNIDYALATLTGTLGALTTSAVDGGGNGHGVAAYNGVSSFAGSHIELYQTGRQVARVQVQPAGRWTIPHLLPGAYSVRAFTGVGYTAFQNITLNEGDVVTLGFVFDPLPDSSVFAFPNPARTSTTIRFQTALSPLQADIDIFDIAGNLVREIRGDQIQQQADQITYHASWDLANSRGQAVASGVYLVMLKVKGGTGNQSAKVIKKVAVVR